MDEEPISFLLDMFGVSIKEIYSGHTVFVPVDYLTDKQAFELAKKNLGAARFIRARLGGFVGGGIPQARPWLYHRCIELTGDVRLGKQGHPNNPSVRKQAEALKQRFNIKLTIYDNDIAACHYIAAAEAIRWPQELQRDKENLSIRRSRNSEPVLNAADIRTLAIKMRAGRINKIISKP